MPAHSSSSRPATVSGDFSIEIKTIAINGRQISGSLFRQIAEDQIFEERTGNLQGEALGYVNIHPKNCLQAWHLHVLWMRNSTLRQSIVTYPEDSTSYHQVEAENQRLLGNLLDLLALVEGMDPKTSLANVESIFHESHETRRKLTLGNFSLSASTPTYRKLVQLRQATICLDHEQQFSPEPETAPRSRTRSQLKTSKKPPSNVSAALAKAQSARQLLTERSISLRHPLLHRFERGEIAWFPYSGKTAHLRQMTSDRWIAYASTAKASMEDWLLLWSPTENERTAEYTDDQINEIEAILQPNVAALRFLLAKENLEQTIEAIRQEIRRKAISLGLIDSQDDQTLPTAATIWQAFQQEIQRFEAYTSQWRKHVETLRTLDQIFIIS